MEPKIIQKGEFKLVGIEAYTGNGFEQIGKAWSALGSRMGEIKNRINPQISYGFEDYSRDFNMEKMWFYYIAAVEVSSLGDIPQGMVSKTVPASKYAVFTHKGTAKEIGNTFRYIYDTWLPQSGHELACEMCCDFEFYDERFNCESENGEMDIYLPIK